MKAALAALALSLAATVPAHAFGVLGMGQQQCREYLSYSQKRDGDHAAAIVQYTYGYLTAWNALATRTKQPQITTSFDSHTILGYYDAFCSQYPLEPIHKGVEFIVQAVLQKQGTPFRAERP